MDKTELKRKSRLVLEPIVVLLERLGATPLLVSLFGVVFSLYGAYVVSKGSLFTGALWLIVGSIADVLDGDLARRRGQETKFGAFIDSTLDRVSELGLFIGLVVYYITRDVDYNILLIVLVMIAMSSSMLISYTRARLEGLGYTCYVGWFERPERMILLIAGLVLGHHVLTFLLVVLAFGTTFTALQRIIHGYRVTQDDDRQPSAPTPSEPPVKIVED